MSSAQAAAPPRGSSVRSSSGNSDEMHPDSIITSPSLVSPGNQGSTALVAERYTRCQPAGSAGSQHFVVEAVPAHCYSYPNEEFRHPEERTHRRPDASSWLLEFDSGTQCGQPPWCTAAGHSSTARSGRGGLIGATDTDRKRSTGLCLLLLPRGDRRKDPLRSPRRSRGIDRREPGPDCNAISPCSCWQAGHRHRTGRAAGKTVFSRVMLLLWFCPGCRNISVDPLTTELVVDRRWTHGRHRRGRAWWGGINTLCTDRDFCGSLRSVHQQHAVRLHPARSTQPPKVWVQ